MPYASLADFMEALERDGQLRRVDAQVDPAGELSEIVRRACGGKPDSDSPALLFSRVAGSDWPVLANCYGSPQRIVRALGVGSPDELCARLASAEPPAGASGLLGRLRRKPAANAAATNFAPRVVKTAPCQQVVKLGRDVDLCELPVPCQGREAERPAILSCQVITRDPDDSSIATFSVPAVIIGPQSLGLVWYPASGLACHYGRARARGEPLPVAIALGACPSLALASEVPLPPGWEPYLVAGMLRGQPLDVVKGRTQPVEPPADAEIVLEGAIDTRAEFVDLGHFITPLGTRAAVQRGPEVEITALTHRANPVLPVRIAGWPWHETAALRRLALRLLLPEAQRLAPDVVDFDAPSSGAGRILFVSLRKRFAGHVQQVAAALWGWPPLANVRLLVVVDEPIDIGEEARVWSQVAAHSDLARDLFSLAGVADPLAATFATGAFGQGVVIDATQKLAGEGAAALTAECSAETIEQVLRRWDQFGLGAIAKNGPHG